MRKKIITALIMAAIILSAFVFCLAACKDTEETGDPVPHSVSITAADDVVAFASVTSATAGTKVTVTVRPPTWKTVTFVTGSGVTCEKDEAASTSTDVVFTFTMPDKDVELTVETIDSGVSVNEDNRMTWVFAPPQIAPSESSYAGVTFEVDFGGNFLANEEGDGNLINVKVTSTNQSVVPDGAIDGAKKIGDSAYTQGATFTIDLSKISTGATTLIFEDTYNNRTITKYLQVVETGTVNPGNIIPAYLEVKFDFDEGDLSPLPENTDPGKLVVLVSVYDHDWIDGTDPDCGASEYTQAHFRLSNTGSKMFAMPYIEGHRYSVSVSLCTYTNDYETDMSPEFSPVDGYTLYVYDNMAGVGNSVQKDDNGTAWLTIKNTQSPVTLTVNRRR